MTYPNAAIIITNFGKKFPDCWVEILINVLKPIINKTPKSPTNIEINFLKENLSSFVKKCENNNAKIGAIESKRPAVLD